jgi:hypothetical protein
VSVDNAGSLQQYLHPFDPHIPAAQIWNCDNFKSCYMGTGVERSPETDNTHIYVFNRIHSCDLVYPTGVKAFPC